MATARRRGPIAAYFLQVALGFDRLFNAIVGGSADETLSSYAHRMRLKGQPYWGWTANAIDRLFFWQPEHCKTSWENEVRRKNPAIETDMAGEEAEIFKPLKRNGE